MDLSPDDMDALKSLGRYRLDRGTAEFFALKKEGVYDFKGTPRVPGLSPDTLQRLLDAGLIHVQVQGDGGDLVTLTNAGGEMVDRLLIDE
jgi:hypothetical protein